MKSTAAPATKSPTMLTTSRPTPARMAPSVRTSGKTAPRRVTVNYKGDPSQDVRQGLKDIKKGSEEVLEGGKQAMAEASPQGRDEILAQAEEKRAKVIEATKQLQGLKTSMNANDQQQQKTEEPKKAEPEWRPFNDEEPDKAQMQSSVSPMRTGSENASHKGAQKVDSPAEQLKESSDPPKANLGTGQQASRNLYQGGQQKEDNIPPEKNFEANQALQEPVKAAHKGVPQDQIPKGPEPYEVLDANKLHAKAVEYRHKHAGETPKAKTDMVEKDIEKSWKDSNAQEPKQPEPWEADAAEEPSKAQMQSSASAMKTGSEDARYKTAQKVDSAAESLKETSSHQSHMRDPLPGQDPSQDVSKGNQALKGPQQVYNSGVQASQQAHGSAQVKPNEGPQTSHLAQDNAKAKADQYPPMIYKMTDTVGRDVDRPGTEPSQEPGKAQMQSSETAAHTGPGYKTGQKIDSSAEQLKESSDNAKKNLEDTAARIRDGARGAGDDFKGQGQDLASKAQSKGEDLSSKAQSKGQDISNKVHQTSQKIEDKVKQAGQNIEDKVKEKEDEYAEAKRAGQEVDYRTDEEPGDVLDRTAEVTTIITDAIGNTAKGLFNAITGAGQVVKDTAVSIKDAAGEEAHEAGDVLSDVTANARAKASDAADRTRDAARDAAHNAEHKLDQTRAKADNAVQNTRDKVKDAGNNAQRDFENTRAKAADAAANTRDKAGDASNNAHRDLGSVSAQRDLGNVSSNTSTGFTDASRPKMTETTAYTQQTAGSAAPNAQSASGRVAFGTSQPGADVVCDPPGVFNQAAAAEKSVNYVKGEDGERQFEAPTVETTVVQHDVYRVKPVIHQEVHKTTLHEVTHHQIEGARDKGITEVVKKGDTDPCGNEVTEDLNAVRGRGTTNANASTANADVVNVAAGGQYFKDQK